MSTIERKTQNYEVLLRFNDDGRVGAHSQTLTGYQEDGVYVSPPIPDTPVTLSLAELQQFVAALTEDDWYVPPQPELAEDSEAE